MKTYQVTFSGSTDRAGPYPIAAMNARQACDIAASAYGCTLTGREVIECKLVGVGIVDLALTEQGRANVASWPTSKPRKASAIAAPDTGKPFRENPAVWTRGDAK